MRSSHYTHLHSVIAQGRAPAANPFWCVCSNTTLPSHTLVTNCSCAHPCVIFVSISLVASKLGKYTRKLTLSWAQKQFVTRVHRLFSNFIVCLLWPHYQFLMDQDQWDPINHFPSRVVSLGPWNQHLYTFPSARDLGMGMLVKLVVIWPNTIKRDKVVCIILCV